MSSKVDIFNMALGNIEAEALVGDPDDDTEEARYCNIYYDVERKWVLRQHPWNFAVRYVALSELTDVTPPDKWAYAYQYPTDCLNALEIAKVNETDPVVPFEVANDRVAGKVIFTNMQDATLRYTADVEDPEMYDDGFVNALAWRIGWRIAGPITGNNSIKNAAYKAAEFYISSAQATDAGEGVADDPPDASWIVVRG